jgi:DNA-binding phage protein
MPLRDFSEIVEARVKRDPEFAAALLDVARLVLRDLVNGSIGFEGLAAVTGTPSKSLHRMLSAQGNPTMDSLTMIFKALREELQVEIRVQTVAVA